MRRSIRTTILAGALSALLLVPAGTAFAHGGVHPGMDVSKQATADGLPANHVFMIRSAGEGRLWVGTSNGLARFDGERFTVFTVHDGLFANNVFSLATTDSGSLWVGGFGGVARLDGLDTVVP